LEILLSSTSSGSSISSSSDSSSSSSSGSGNYSPITSPASGFLVNGTIQTGNNALDGTPEYLLGGSVGSSQPGQCVWATSLAGGFDSGNNGFELTADLSGTDGVTLGIDNPTASGIISASLANSGAISRVQIAAQAQSGGRFRFGSLKVDFYRNGQLAQSVAVGVDGLPDADASGTEESFQGVEVTPTASNNDQVHVSGVFQMTGSMANTLPNVSGLILVFN
jgi:hypothetical protein